MWFYLSIILSIVLILIVMGIIPSPSQSNDVTEVAYASTSDVNIKNPNRVDGEFVVHGNVYLLQHQNDSSENGIYEYRNGKFFRLKNHAQLVYVLYGTFAHQIILHKPSRSTSKLRVQEIKTDVLHATQISGTLQTSDQPKVTSLGTLSKDLNMGGKRINNIPLPLSGSDVANQSYVDNYAQGMTWREAVVTCTITTLPGLPTYDNGTGGVGATLSASSGALGTINGYSNWEDGVSRLLVKNQANDVHNGVYVVTQHTDPYILTRAEDFDGNPNHETTVGTAVLVSAGHFQNYRFVLGTLQSRLTTPPNVLVGTDPFTWVLVSSPVQNAPQPAIFQVSTTVDLNSSTFVSPISYTAIFPNTNYVTLSGTTFTIIAGGRYSVLAQLTLIGHSTARTHQLEIDFKENGTTSHYVFTNMVSVESDSDYVSTKCHFNLNVSTGDTFQLLLKAVNEVGNTQLKDGEWSFVKFTPEFIK